MGKVNPNTDMSDKVDTMFHVPRVMLAISAPVWWGSLRPWLASVLPSLGLWIGESLETRLHGWSHAAPTTIPCYGMVVQ